MEKKEAMEILKDFHDKSALFSVRTALNTVLPELQEDEDERIRKEIISFLKSPFVNENIIDEKVAPWVEWLEKQSKYETIWKPTKEQIAALTHFVRSVGESGYASPYDNNTKLLYSLLSDLQVLEKQGEQKNLAQNQEPKTENEKIRKELIDFLWKEKIFLQEVHSSVENSPRYRFVMDAIAWLEKQNHDGKKWIYEDVYLKEKEQLIQDGIDEVLENPQKYGLEKQGEQKSAWSEEDEKMFDYALDMIEWYGGEYEEKARNVSNWLKSLKQRLQ